MNIQIIKFYDMVCDGGYTMKTDWEKNFDEFFGFKEEADRDRRDTLRLVKFWIKDNLTTFETITHTNPDSKQ